MIISEGDKLIDKESSDEDEILILVHKPDSTADVFQINYDYHGDPITVHDHNENYPKDDRVLGCVYQSTIDQEFLDDKQNKKELVEKLRDKRKVYYFPESRVEKVEDYTCDKCGKVLTKEDIKKDGPPELGWEVIECPECGETVSL